MCSDLTADIVVIYLISDGSWRRDLCEKWRGGFGVAGGGHGAAKKLKAWRKRIDVKVICVVCRRP